jgi:predicted DNA-binding transcriptional regulator YafY
MRMDRLLNLVLYLLNRDTVSARSLAEKFEVSTRTIQRDMETLSVAGIPIGSTHGTNIKMNRQILHPEDYNFILTALKGLSSGYDNSRLEATFEKIHALSPSNERPEQHIKLDLKVLREGERTSEDLACIEDAILKRYTIEFDYTDTEGRISHRRIEPKTTGSTYLHQY